MRCYALAIAFWFWTALGAVALAQPVNDGCATAVAIATLPFTTSVDTTTATSDLSDPTSVCGVPGRNVWYAYTADRAISLAIDTAGSAIEPRVSVFTGTCSAFSEIGCHSDDDLNGDVRVVVAVAAGQTAYIRVGDDAGGLLSLHVDQAPFDAAPPVSVGPFVLSGDPSPLGGALATFHRTAMLSTAETAFTATTDGVFADLGAGLVTIAVSGDPAPGGGTISTVGPPVVSTAGDVAFFATVDGGTGAGIFRSSGGVLTAIVRAGDAAPGGGRFVSFGPTIAGSAGGVLAFIGRIDSSSREAIYPVHGSVVGPALLRDLDLNPCGGMIRSLGFSSPSFGINDTGEIVAYVDGTPGGIVRVTGNVRAAVACQGGATPLGGTFKLGNRPVIGDGSPNGPIVFASAIVQPGTDPQAIFKDDGGGLTVVAKTGDLTLGGQTIAGFLLNLRPAINAFGAVAFQADTSAGLAALVRTPTMAAAAVQRSVGTPCSAGGTFVDFDNWIAFDDAGTLAFAGGCTSTQGILRLAPGPGLTTVADVADTTAAGPGFAFAHPSLRGGRLAFDGSRTGVFRRTCGTSGCSPITAIAHPLQPIPGLIPGESILTILPDSLVGSGALATFLVSTIGGGERREAVLTSRHGTLALIVATGIPLALPGTTLEPTRFSSLDTVSSVATELGTDGRSVAFVAAVKDTVSHDDFDGLFLKRSGTVTQIARDDAPAPNGEDYIAFGAPIVKGRAVTFRGGDTDSGCLFSGDGTATSALVCHGRLLPPGVGGTVEDILPDVAVSGSSYPVVRVTTASGSPAECLFSAGSGLMTIACAGQPLPGGGTVEAFDLADSPIIAAEKLSRRVVTTAHDAANENGGLFGFGAGWVTRIVRDGGAAPAGVGGTLSPRDARPVMHGKYVVFLATVNGGTRCRGIFRAKLKR
jgi:hypothetical protein